MTTARAAMNGLGKPKVLPPPIPVIPHVYPEEPVFEDMPVLKVRGDVRVIYFIYICIYLCVVHIYISVPLVCGVLDPPADAALNMYACIAFKSCTGSFVDPRPCNTILT